MSKVLFISVKPEYATKILSGEKTIELRKSSPNVNRGDMVIIYSTRPVMAVIGVCKVKDVFKTSPSNMWRKHSKTLGIDKRNYDLYFENSEMAIGIEVTDACKLSNEIILKNIKKLYPNFNPPQTFKYFSLNEVLRSYHKLNNSVLSPLV